jgi:uncharacterized protein YaiL (DUF2058 family)
VGNSLQDQLLKAGLVDEDRIKKANKSKKQQQRQQPKAKKKARKKPALSPEQIKAREEKAARDRELNERKNEARKQREIAAQIKQLVDANRHPSSDPDNDVPFYFENKGKIKTLHVAPATRDMITAGKLLIVNANGKFELVPPDIAEKIRARNPALVIDLPQEEKPAEDDPYAGYEVPDDLMW